MKGLRQDLGFNLGVLFRAYVKASNVVLADIPGGPRGYQILTAAVHGDAGSQVALCRELGVDRTVMTYLVDDLEKAGLVRREPDPRDRRNRRIVITEGGRETWEHAERRLRAVGAHLLGDLPEAEATAFRQTLEHLARRADAADPVSHRCQLVEDL
ncbi:winged helix-turn-helix transcriptional regulator [Herbidospora galbida]|uniref:Winged helix-turn-helix transcriptional regulator n=1 Tax=Herbidospora galbida TaxID=2575442 RepID=A0A4U3MDJ8_9ACTN|nr:MarR family winged helix-turn-helix transcriptional regulator [Herbidospora galbida]TKK87141.1 winged helix-turn-helix transcriptional regulator [Herbidospora galbida]